MRFNQFQSVQLNAATAPGFSSGQAIAALEETFKQTMPTEMGFDYMGMSYQEKKAAEGVSPAVVFALAFFIVFLIMAAQYESWTLPLAVLLGTPIAVFGAFLALYGRHLENDVYAQIGLVMLIGMAAKNAILIVEFAKMEYDKGKPLVEASLTAAKLRLRPILMTAFAFILGCVPLWAASGAGAVSRQVLGTVVIGGMLAASILAIFFIPVSFVVIERFGYWIGLGKPKPEARASLHQKRRECTYEPGRGVWLLSCCCCHYVVARWDRITSGLAVTLPDQYRRLAPEISNQTATASIR